MRFKTRLFQTFAVLMTLSLIFMISACEKDLPMTAEQPLVNNSSQVTILKIKDAPISGLEKLFATKALIDEDGGSISVGDEAHGYSYLNFPAGAIDEADYDYDGGVVVRFYWESESLLQADFYPEGLTFDEPVYIRLSYKDASLKGVDEEDLGIYYYNPTTGNWELISNQVNTTEKYVEGYIDHFSRYAIGME